jgi:hypothetical protein
MVEFQETQAFFVLATQISIITILSRRLGTFESYSTTQSDWNNQFLLLIESAGLYTISVPLLLLQSARMDSWYILLVSFFGSAMALASIVFSRGNKFPDTIMPIPQAALLKSCGGNSPPIALCPSLKSFYSNIGYSSGVPLNTSEMPYRVRRDYFPTTVQVYQNTQHSVKIPMAPWNTGMVAFWIIVTIYLLLHKTVVTFYKVSKRVREKEASTVTADPRDSLDSTDRESTGSQHSENSLSRPRSRTNLESGEQSGADNESRWKRKLQLALAILSLVLECVAIGMMTSVIISFRNWQVSGVMILNDWTLGQVIALFIWAPVVSKYLYWTMCMF